jgi:hypothetical protein
MSLFYRGEGQNLPAINGIALVGLMCDHAVLSHAMHCPAPDLQFKEPLGTPSSPAVQVV